MWWFRILFRADVATLNTAESFPCRFRTVAILKTGVYAGLISDRPSRKVLRKWRREQRASQSTDVSVSTTLTLRQSGDAPDPLFYMHPSVSHMGCLDSGVRSAIGIRPDIDPVRHIKAIVFARHLKMLQ